MLTSCIRRAQSILPKLLEIVVQCRDAMSQGYLLDAIVQVFPDSFHAKTVDSLLVIRTNIGAPKDVSSNDLQNVESTVGNGELLLCRLHRNLDPFQFHTSLMSKLQEYLSRNQSEVEQRKDSCGLQTTQVTKSSVTAQFNVEDTILWMDILYASVREFAVGPCTKEKQHRKSKKASRNEESQSEAQNESSEVKMLSQIGAILELFRFVLTIASFNQRHITVASSTWRYAQRVSELMYNYLCTISEQLVTKPDIHPRKSTVLMYDKFYRKIVDFYLAPIKQLADGGSDTEGGSIATRVKAKDPDSSCQPFDGLKYFLCLPYMSSTQQIGGGKVDCEGLTNYSSNSQNQFILDFLPSHYQQQISRSYLKFLTIEKNNLRHRLHIELSKGHTQDGDGTAVIPVHLNVAVERILQTLGTCLLKAPMMKEHSKLSRRNSSGRLSKPLFDLSRVPNEFTNEFTTTYPISDEILLAKFVHTVVPSPSSSKTTLQGKGRTKLMNRIYHSHSSPYIPHVSSSF